MISHDYSKCIPDFAKKKFCILLGQEDKQQQLDVCVSHLFLFGTNEWLMKLLSNNKEKSN